MKVTILQTDLAWEDREANIEHITKLIKENNVDPDLIVLPEMFTTGFSMNSVALSETMTGDTLKWMQETASVENCALTGSIIIREDERVYNRLLFVYPDKKVVSYDKRHLFMMENENNAFSPGLRQLITPYKEFNINLQICYDLRFPVWSRCVDNNYDILIYVASWPEARRNVWNSLLIARAIENQCYVIGLNRIGEDGEGITYSGDSVIIGPKGEIIASAEPYQEGAVSADISLDKLNQFREKFSVWKDADRFNLIN